MSPPPTIALALMLALLPFAAGRPRRAEVALVAAGVLAAVLVWAAGPQAIPVHALRLLREGNDFLLHRQGAGVIDGVAVVRWQAHRSLVTALVAAGLLGAVLWRRLGAGGALLLAAVVPSPWVLRPALAEEPAAACWLATVGLAVGWAGASSGVGRRRAAGVGVVAAAGWALARLRPELVAPAASVALPLLAMTLWPGLRRWEGRVARWPWWVPAVLAVALSSLGLQLVDPLARPPGPLRPGLPGSEQEVASLLLPLGNLPVLLGPGVGGLALCGVVVRAREGFVGLLGVAGLLVAVRAVALSSHLGEAPWEDVRYGAPAAAAWLLLAADGAGWLVTRTRATASVLGVTTLGLVAVPLLVPPHPGWRHGEVHLREGGLHAVVEALEAEPGCIFRAVRAAGLRADGNRAFGELWFGGPLAGRTPPERWEELAAALREIRATPCWRAWRGVDASLPGAPWQDPPGPPRRTWTLRGADINTHHGVVKAPVTVGVWDDDR